MERCSQNVDQEARMDELEQTVFDLGMAHLEGALRSTASGNVLVTLGVAALFGRTVKLQTLRMF